MTPTADVAFRVLRIEQQLESYQRLHQEELGQIRAALEELKQQILLLAQKEVPVPEDGHAGDGH